jgi:Tfp pilus assembly PilM family ATPase
MANAGMQANDLIVLECGGCKHTNHSSAKFCGGCGHSLYENCPQCATPVTLTKQFCGACGADLVASMREKLDAAHHRIEQSLLFAKDFRFDAASDLLRSLAAEKDYRFAEPAGIAKQALQKIAVAKEKAVAKVHSASAVVKNLDQREDAEEIIRLLEPLPSVLLDEASKSKLAKAKALISEKAHLLATLKAALSEKDWLNASSCIERCIELFPEEPRFRAYASQVSQKLLDAAKNLQAKFKYAEALDAARSLPSTYKSEEADNLRQHLSTAVWLVEQLQNEPLATPTLGRIAVRLAKHAPDDPMGKSMASSLASKLKEQNGSKRSPFPPWYGSGKSSLGGEVSILGWPESIQVNGIDAIRKNPSRFSIAYGLALQGLAESLVSERLNPKKGFLANLGGRKKAKVSWGIDIGASGIKAVLLERDGVQIKATNAYLKDYSIPAIQVREAIDPAVVQEAIKTMVADLGLTDQDIWVNLPAREVLPRFVVLPPVDDKKASQLLEKEMVGQFPVALDQLGIVSWISGGSDASFGRPTAIVAARKAMIEQRIDFLKHAGLNVEGLQCDQVALVNYVHREFADSVKRGDGERAIPALAVIESGASCATLCIIDSDGFWFRTIDGGGMDLTLTLARAAKVVATEAELLKRDPSRIALPADQWTAIEEKSRLLASRIKSLLAEAMKDRLNLDVRQTWLTGGSSFLHGWARQLIERS